MMRDAIPCLYIVVPCYNEEKVLPITSKIFLEKLKSLIKQQKISPDSRILFVNDGSADKSWEIICDLAKQDEHYLGISQSRNRGDQSTILAGLMEAKDRCDITISTECDGQDDINAIDDMVAAYQNGYEVVYGVRNKREVDTMTKRFSAEGFYKLMNWMGAETVFNHADYRLISSRALQELSDFPEVNLFLRGMVPLVGFKSTCVYYERDKRLAGETHYTYKKLFDLAVNGITSLSVKPIRMITTFGALVSTFSFLGIIGAAISGFMGKSGAGLCGIICIMCFLAGVQLLCLGVLGEYIGKVYLETKRRPRYIISERTYDKQ